MSLYDYRVSLDLAKQDVPFYALIMAAIRKADDVNLVRIDRVFPHVVKEFKRRYHAPGGMLPEDEVNAHQDQSTSPKIPQGSIKGMASSRQVFINGAELTPAASQNLCNHSPDGFAWGYGGSGPAQLALAIALALVDDQTALLKYQELKAKFIVPLHQDKDFELSIAEVYTFLMS